MICIRLLRERDRLDWSYWPKLKTSTLALPAEIIGAYNPDFSVTDVASRRMYWLAGKNAPFVCPAVQAAKGADQAAPIQIRLNISDDLASKLTALHLLLAVNARTL